MTEPACIVAMQDRVHCKNIEALWVVKMAFEGYVVKVWQILRQLFSVLTLFDDVLLLKPMPRSVDLSKILNNQTV